MLNFDTYYTNKFEQIKAHSITQGLSDADAKDLAQNVLIDLWKRFSSGELDENKNIDAYLFRRVRWRMIDRMRRNQEFHSKHESVGLDNNLDSLLEPLPVQNSDKSVLNAAIKCSKKTKGFAIFFDSTFNELTTKELCDKFSVTAKTAYVEKCRERKKFIQTAKTILCSTQKKEKSP